MNARIIKRQFVELEASSAGTPSASPRERHHAKKQARLVEDGGVVRAVEIVCTCGETTIVELAFELATPERGVSPERAASNERGARAP